MSTPDRYTTDPPDEFETFTGPVTWGQRIRAATLSAVTLPWMGWRYRKGSVVILGVVTAVYAVRYILRDDWVNAASILFIGIAFTYVVGTMARSDLIMRRMHEVEKMSLSWGIVGDDLLKPTSRKSAVGLTFRSCSDVIRRILDDLKRDLTIPALRDDRDRDEVSNDAAQ